MNISIDIETFSSVNLVKAGVYKYCESPDFEILLFGYSVDGGPVQVVDLAGGEKIPDEILAALQDETVTKWAFNANFERICLSQYLGMPTGTYLNPASWRCTMVWVATLGLPLSLEGVGAVLGLEKQKLKEGKDLVLYFCTPAKAKDGSFIRHYSTDAPDKWETFKAYNQRDVETEMAIQERLSKFPVSDAEWENYRLDQEINDRGVALDMELVQQAIAMDGRSRTELTQAMKDLTELDNPNSVQQMKRWLAENGLETDTLGKKAVAELIAAAPPELQKVLSLRQQLAKSSVKKYQAMQNAVCADGRARGMFQFYGANRSGRWAGRIIQLQNLRQNHLPDLEQARSLVRRGDYDAVELLYEDVPDTLSQLVRTAFIPKSGNRFFVADFSAIEARVIAWLASEHWKSDAFARGEDIYCVTASKMFHVPVVKHGENAELRQKGKVAELACIAEGQLVLTNRGEITIEAVQDTDLLWDGNSWVRHGGVIYKGEREVIQYEGLRATPDHLVWIEGQQEPVQLGLAAASGAHLIQTGDGGRAVRLGQNNFSGEAVGGQDLEQMLCPDPVHRMRQCSMAAKRELDKRKESRLPELFSAKAGSPLARQTSDGSEATVREPIRSRLSELWCKRNKVRLPERDCCRALSNKDLWPAAQRDGDRQDKQRWGLRTEQHPICNPFGEQPKQEEYRVESLRAEVLALCGKCCYSKAIAGPITGRGNSGCRNCCFREEKELETHIGKARLYDIRDAGEHHRFTVSGKLVHNCGYGGSAGALKAMGALEMGLAEAELKPLVDAWRQSNPRICRFWWDVDSAAKQCIKERCETGTHSIRFVYQSGMMFVYLPSGRRMAYVKPKIGENRFGGECITYEGVGEQKKWQRIESYGPKVVENCVQGLARDILAEAMLRLNAAGYKIVMHVHDEVVIEAPADTSLEAVCEIMGQTPTWAKGLPLSADGYVCDFYMKE